MKVVSDSSVLITLENTGMLSILEKLHEEILIPPAVKREVFKKRSHPEFIRCVEISQPLAIKVLESKLGAGESEAICLYEEIKADLLLIDDLDGRRLSEMMEIEYTGVLGILVAFKRKNLIPEIKPLLDKIIKNGFRVSSILYKKILEKSNE